VDFRHPVEAVIPGVQGRILAVLAETTAELNLRTIARLGDVSPSQASRVLSDLVELGLVERREAPPSALFLLQGEHVAARAVRALSRAWDDVIEELARLAARIDPAPATVAVFGSFARREADTTSDLDVVLIRAPGVDEGSDEWLASVDGWRAAAARLTGNPVRTLEVGYDEVAGRVRPDDPMWSDVIRDGITLFGDPITNLVVAAGV
jgi:DNA-binding MarR family transcriptional regulator